ncbi:unannotated protein [freshwater metagenome]|uniref:Unannotated protein n=1 Tax=freshwater metagenome TaxID=449393 RepID=A0A6J7AK50_9ZZZZ
MITSHSTANARKIDNTTATSSSPRDQDTGPASSARITCSTLSRSTAGSSTRMPAPDNSAVATRCTVESLTSQRWRYERMAARSSRVGSASDIGATLLPADVEPELPLPQD